MTMTSNLPLQDANLSMIDKKLLVKAFDIYTKEGSSDVEAYDKALFAVGRTSNDITCHALTSNINLQTAISKEGGLFNKNYFFDATISSDTEDDQDEVASSSLLQWLDNNQRIDNTGDVKHIEFDGLESGWKGLFKMLSHKMLGNKLDGKFVADKSHPKFKEFLKMHEEKPFTMLSAEFYNPKKIGNKIVYADRLGWTLTNKGSNPDAMIHN